MTYMEALALAGNLHLWRTACRLITVLVVVGSLNGARASNIEEVTQPAPQQGVDWLALLRQSVAFTGIQHSFRLMTEPGTRNGFRSSFWSGYAASAGNLHGWGDGDPFYVNYVGHPMQGAVSGYLWIQNDRRYRAVEFGRNRDYWRSRLRAAAFSFAYSEQFEVGLFSEASVGHIQSRFPQQGFVDHVVTPVIGTGWVIAEDAIDKYVIRRLEDRFQNNWIRLLVRSSLNPSRSFANALRGQVPWHRDSRDGVYAYRPAKQSRSSPPVQVPYEPSEVAKFEFTTSFLNIPTGSAECIGGGGEAAYRIAPQWQAVASVGGCGFHGLRENMSGDALQYMAGIRWTPRPESRWSPHAQFLFGGVKTTQELLFPEKKAALEAVLKGRKDYMAEWKHAQYTQQAENNRFAWSAGAGVDYRITRALAFRALTVDLTPCCALPLDNIEERRTVRVSSGLVLRMGTW